MNQIPVLHLDKLLTRIREEISQGHYELSWKLLEDAHILGQPYAFMHLYVHLVMLKLALIERSFSEVFGQLIRIILAVPTSIFGRYPRGNNGRMSSGLFKTYPIEARLEDKIRELNFLENKRIKSGGTLQKKTNPFLAKNKKR